MEGSIGNKGRFLLGILIFLCEGALFFLILLPGSAGSGTYLSTKHGDGTGNGVNRSAVTGSPYPDAASPYPRGHCDHCHEPHASVEGNEPTPPTSEGAVSYALFRSNFGANKNKFCYACHDTFVLNGMPLSYGYYGIYQGSTKYNASIHYSNSYMIWPSAKLLYGNVTWPPYSDAGNCINCHNPHGYSDSQGVIPRMLIARDSATGDSPAYEMTCEGCHDGSVTGAKNIKAQLDKTQSRHPTHLYNNRHTLPETGESEGGHSFGNPPAYDKRHAECVDCHNPHTVVSGTVHTAGTTGNAVSDVLKYVWGVEPTWPSIWTQPTGFTVRRPSTYPDGSQYEYQICFKCHSYYGLGTVTNGVSTITGPSGSPITDQAWEFNKNNKSVHPVVVSLNNQTGSYAPKALTSAQMSAPWTNVGTQTMYCSDCHGADDEGTGGAKGPHGSNVKYMLKGTGKYWPTKSDGVTLWRLNTTDAQDTNLFCKNCHPIYSGGWKNNVHSKWNHTNANPTCVTCHAAVPHGSKRSRLIAYYSDVSPYNYGGNNAQLLGFKKAAGPTSYSSSNCQTQSCGSYTHNSPVSGADP